MLGTLITELLEHYGLDRKKKRKIKKEKVRYSTYLSPPSSDKTLARQRRTRPFMTQVQVIVLERRRVGPSNHNEIASDNPIFCP